MRARTKEGWFVKCFIVASALMLVMAGSACSQTIPCQTYDRSSTYAPQFVRDWLEGDPEAFYVKACGVAVHRRYFGASNLVHDGNVCRYSAYVLDLSDNPARLQRKATPPLAYMLVSESEMCPSPLSEPEYAQIFDGVPQDVFERLTRIWRDAIASPASFDRATFWAFSVDNRRRHVRSQLRDVVSRGRSDRLAVLTVMRENLGLWKSYGLEVRDPDHFNEFYEVTMSRIGWTYAITDIDAGIY
jgi:hypothetical protein